MGACECENPMEFGYEVNAQEKDEQPSTKNKYKEYNPNTSNNNYMNNVSNVISTDSNRLKQSNYNTQGRIYEINENQNINNRPIEEEEEEEKQGVDALRARYENEKNPNDESDEIFQSNTNNNNKQFLFNTSVDNPGDDFSKYIFDGINSIRENPQSFIPIIERAKNNIMYDKKGICVYKSSVKVALSKGIPAFDESIDYLKNLRPMQKLIFSSELLIPPPENEDQIKDKTYMNEIINEKVQSGIPIKSFWRDIIKDRETCLILMIVDDTGANSGKKRNDILDPTMQCIGITSKKIGKNFASYVTLC
jgi:hypothetical protein